eukprot:scaffold31396_cov72-Phaeocystis_antarctica.AAC.3
MSGTAAASTGTAATSGCPKRDQPFFGPSLVASAVASGVASAAASRVARSDARASASARRGRLGMAPSRETAIAPAAAARASASGRGRPSTRATQNAARNESPAPVSSTTAPPGTAHGGCRKMSPSSVRSSAPSAPSVTSTARAPRACSARAAPSTSASVPVGIPLSRASSVSLGSR